MIKKIKHYLEHLQKPALVLGIVVVLALLAFKFGLISLGDRLQFTSSAGTEIAEIKATPNVDEQVRLYTSLIKRVGPKQAQIDLFQSGLPFTGQTHLLNHTAGDYLYEKYGPAGLIQCMDYFLSSCYHGFLLHAIADGGMPQVEKAFVECKKVGPAVSSQCAHAIGHGFLTNGGYKNLVGALETCDQAAQTMPGFPAFNCYDGVFMENIWAVHEGSPSPDRWVKEGDMMYPCNDPRIDKKYILACWSNQPSLVYQHSKGDVKKVADVCIKVKETEFQQMCFDGLARQIHPLTQGKAALAFDLCGNMPNEKWNNFCVYVNAGSSYAVGDRVVPFEICGQIRESGKADCYNRLLSMMGAYKKPGENLKNLCTKITDADWRGKCENTF